MKRLKSQVEKLLLKNKVDLTIEDYKLVFDLLTKKRLIDHSFYKITKENVKWVYEQKEIDQLLFQFKLKIKAEKKIL
jgi:hypothetical protein